MDEALIAQKLNDIIRVIEHLPVAQRDTVMTLAQKTQLSHQNLTESMEPLQRPLDYLRVSLKYLLFDLEATRRENKQLRQLMEKKCQE
jgi:hypothetical protein